MPDAHNQVAWHELPVENALGRLGADIRKGLSSADVEKRRAAHGWNRMKEKPGVPAWLKFLRQFNQALVYILLAATALSSVLGEWIDASVIFAVVLLNALIGFIQESKAEKALDALARMVKTEATLRRDGKKVRVPSEDLVPGDVVLLQSGDSVPADLRLVVVRNAQVEEAALTGESVPAPKKTDPLPPGTGLGDRANMAYAGTLVTVGQAEGVVTAIGDGTETGRIATLIGEAADLSTPLTRKIAGFSRVLLYVILALSGVAFLAGVLRGAPASEMFMAGIALAVGAIPEGLPAALTITLAIGVTRMAARHAIIRRLPAVETLGSTTVVCSDKTGTLTENQMTVSLIHSGGLSWNVTGAGYEAAGEIRPENGSADPGQNEALKECLLAGVLCNESQLRRQNGRLQVEGDPTEAALLVSARKANLDQGEANRRFPREGVIPFESEHMYMATLHGGEGNRRIYLKGSVERILERCSEVADQAGRNAALDPGKIHKTVDAMTQKGLRVLALAKGSLPPGKTSLTPDDVKEGLTLLGLQGMIDPPRAEAIRAVALCRKAGIAVKMITGDHRGTAAAVARDVGLA